MAKFADIMTAYPESSFAALTRAQAIELGHIRADVDEPWVCLWFDGTQEPPSIIAGGHTAALARQQLELDMVESVVL